MARSVIVTATIIENDEEVSSSVTFDINDVEGEEFGISFKYNKSESNGGPIVVPSTPPFGL